MVTMRVWVFRSRGTPAQVLKLETDLLRPTAKSLGPRDVLIKVKYSALFQGMAMLMSQIPHFDSKPWFAEGTFSGIVEAEGSQVDHLKPEDEVFGGLPPNVFMKYGGTLAEHIILPDQVVVQKPRNLAFEGAGGIASNAVTALQFVEVAKLKKGGRVLITGASSGTGSIVIQAARAAVGEEGLVVGTCSGANEQLVKSLGVHEVIDYTKCAVLHEYLAQQYGSKRFDAIIDIVGGDWDLYTKSPAYLKPDSTFIFGGNISIVHGGASFVSVVFWLLSIRIASRRPVILGGVPRKCLLHQGKIDRENLLKAAALIEEGKLKPVIDSVYEMEDVLKV
ncbi:uncharacterized protein Z518_08939 [Rhinocladiella mackenziei CBS 650.93]|uniref:Enoyl reductase (ER) domain-containing protein n=1 Tax=Rhinocladiella mackenziei CBS 650.93 TaxID=1442369 RepID=A0A0D2I5Y6_9EURO|nr:uncharacterized protein Z518_08939 [Rhinocladiella mackenziei CBS 650.93]KIX01214.1 hypothetical protein Z518_08939 [Rhinocladiella mackenziei CBS 650.93]